MDEDITVVPASAVGAAEPSVCERILTTLKQDWGQPWNRDVWELYSRAVFCRDGKPWQWRRIDYITPLMQGDVDTLKRTMEQNARYTLIMHVLEGGSHVTPWVAYEEMRAREVEKGSGVDG